MIDWDEDIVLAVVGLLGKKITGKMCVGTFRENDFFSQRYCYKTKQRKVKKFEDRGSPRIFKCATFYDNVQMWVIAYV